MRTPLPIILLLVCSSCTGPINSRVQTKTSVADSSAPKGFVPFPKPSKDSDALRCANYSAREWRVSLSAEQLQIRLDTKRDHQDALPSEITSKNVVVGSKGERHVIPVNDGWLIGIDVGEFGGGLWWFGTDGSRSKKLSDENVHGFVNTSIGTLAIVGLGHLGVESGQVLRITSDKAGNRKSEIFADFGFAPAAFVAESPDSIIILTTFGLVRMKTSGSVERLLRTNYRDLYPTSMTLSASGVLHVGMRHFVTRLTPIGNSYEEEWFAPADCTAFTTPDCDCIPAGR